MVATRLNDEELRAWQTFLRAHHVVTDTLDDELSREQDLPLGSYEVLLHLSEAPGHALRMSELADQVMLSRSGVSRLVDRLVSEGLVERHTCQSDGRGVYAGLTDAGMRRLRVPPDAPARRPRALHRAAVADASWTSWPGCWTSCC